MTVKELIELLGKYDENLEVFFSENSEPVSIGRLEYHKVDHDEWEDWDMPEGYEYLEVSE